MLAKSEVLKAIFALAAISLLSSIGFDLGPVPISLQTFVIFVSASLLNWRTAILVLLLYLALGALGLPVFADYSSGFKHLHGPTAGFLWGFVCCAAYVAWESQRKVLTPLRGILIFLQAHFLLLIPGFLVLSLLIAEVNIWDILLDLLPGLIIKSILGGIIAASIRGVVS